jgi:hypothetical protein
LETLVPQQLQTEAAKGCDVVIVQVSRFLLCK